MAGKLSAGLLLFRVRDPGAVEVMLVHMGGPFWARRDDGAWSLPKGEHEERDDPLAAAEREFGEELGRPAPAGARIELGAFRQPSRKVIRAWAIEADLDVSEITGTTFELEWPKGSGRLRSFPEVDRAAWFSLDEARAKLVPGHVPFLDALTETLAERGGAG